MLHQHSSICKDKFDLNLLITIVLIVSHAGKICVGGGGKPFFSEDRHDISLSLAKKYLCWLLYYHFHLYRF